MTKQPTSDEGRQMARFAYYGLSTPEDELLSSLLDVVQARIEWHQSEIARLRPILHRLQERIPTDCFAEFISTLEADL